VPNALAALYRIKCFIFLYIVRLISFRHESWDGKFGVIDIKTACTDFLPQNRRQKEQLDLASVSSINHAINSGFTTYQRCDFASDNGLSGFN
jgi:hypothetical protein